MEAYQIVYEHALRTVMLRPFAIVDRAMVESMEVKKSFMMQLGVKVYEMSCFLEAMGQLS